MRFSKAVLVSIVAVMVSKLHVHGAPQTGNNETSTTERIDGDYLLQLGVSFDNPLIRLLGRAMIRKEKEIEALGKNLDLLKGKGEGGIGAPEKSIEALEKSIEALEKKENDNHGEILNKICEMHPCGDWSEWSDCPVFRKGRFSMVTRSRECGKNTSLCTYRADVEFTSRESKVCEGVCPPEYSSNTGMCLKIYKEGLNYEAAQAKCQADGGHLVNVNTQAKSDIVNTFINAHGSNPFGVWINGMKKQSGTDWEYSYGNVPDMENWRSGEPNENRYPNCKGTSVGKWYDAPCKTGYYYLCEVTEVSD